jgi:hypothetical protein
MPTADLIPGPVTYGFPGRFWTSFEYLLWTTRNAPLPISLLTTTSSGSSSSGSSSSTSAPTTDTDQTTGTPSSSTTGGTTTSSGTLILIGMNGIDYGNYDGFRLAGGYWLTPEQTLGIEARAFYVEPLSLRLTVAGTSQPSGVLSRPFFDVGTQAPATLVVAQPGAATGAVQFFSRSRLWGADANAVAGWGRSGEGYLTDLLFGARVLELEEGINISQNSTALASGTYGFNGAAVLPPNGIGVADRFQTQNRFYGGQAGWRGECRWDPFFVNLTAVVALGWTRQTVNVLGNTTFVSPAGVAVTPGGLLATAGTSGRRSHGEVTAVPEVGLNVGVRCTDWLRFFIGYSALYWSSVVRPGDQISPSVNAAQVPSSTAFGSSTGSAEPTPLFLRRDFWAQGVNFGVEVHY